MRVEGGARIVVVLRTNNEGGEDVITSVSVLNGTNVGVKMRVEKG